VETLVPEPLRAGVEGVAEEGSAPRVPVAEETRVLVPADVQDEGVVAAMMAQAALGSVVPVVQLQDSSEEFGDSRDIDPAAAASAADKITEFTSACEEVLNEGTSKGPHHGRSSSPGSPRSSSTMSGRRRASGRRRSRQALRF